jgi:Undecaprenyl-phosphate galactose phosphotransferase WbaP
MTNTPLKSQYRSTYPEIKQGFLNSNSRVLKEIFLAISDLFCLALSLTIAVYVRFLVQGQEVPVAYFDLIPYLVIAVLIFQVTGLYANGMSPVQELQRLTIATSVVFLALAALSFFLRDADNYSRLSYGIGWILSIVFVPLGREFTRVMFVRSGLFGEPVVVIGYGPNGYEIAEYLVDNPKSGLYPVVVVDRRTQDRGTPPRVPVIRSSDILEHPEMIEIFKGIDTAILVTNEINDEFVDMIVEERVLQFRHLIVITNSRYISSLWIRPYEIGEMLGLEIGQNLLSVWQRAVKRLIDLSLVTISLPFIIPFFALVSLLIVIDSRGNVFYHQMRLGQKNRYFKMWKFRTMHADADAKLKSYLEANPDLKAEWEANHKLKKDPRITRVGHFLRKFSLDEFPQLINVLKGDMSLVGPRPIVHDEVQFYGKLYPIYCEVLPGMTGLWQISGRSDTSYVSRVHLDEYYVRNWSIWLDYFIMTRTGLVVVLGKGSY